MNKTAASLHIFSLFAQLVMLTSFILIGVNASAVTAAPLAVSITNQASYNCNNQYFQRTLPLQQDVVGIKNQISVGVIAQAEFFPGGVSELEVSILDGQNIDSPQGMVTYHNLTNFTSQGSSILGKVQNFNIDLKLKKQQVKKLLLIVRARNLRGENSFVQKEIYAMNANESVSLVDQTHSCHMSLPAKTIGNLYYNDQVVEAKTIEYSVYEEHVDVQELNKYSGVIEISQNNGGKGINTSTPETKVVASFFGVQNYEAHKSNILTTTISYPLHAKRAAWLVQWDIEELAPIDRMEFNSCGLLQVTQKNVGVFKKFFSSHQMMAVETDQANNDLYLQKLLSRFETINTCKDLKN